MIALILADPDKDFDREIRWALKGNKDISVRAFATKLNQIEALVKEHAPCVLLIGPGWKGKPIADLAKDIREKTNTTVILSVNGSKPYNQKKAASAHMQGIDFLTFPTRTDELISTIQRAYEILRETIASTGNKGKILTIFSTKGGVGKTVIATNLAVSLARDHGTSVVLLDLDLQFGDIGVMLKLNPEHTIYDAACMGENLDIEVLSGFLASHDSGVRALLAPLQPELADLVDLRDLQTRVQQKLQELISQEKTTLTPEEKIQLVESITHDVLGYGPLEEFLDDPEVTEIMVNGPDTIYIIDEAHLRRIIDKIVAQVGRRIDESANRQ